MRVHLTRKLAERIDGVDLSAHREGDTFDLPTHEAELLIAEVWATPAFSRTQEVRGCSFTFPCAEAASLRTRVKHVAQQLEEGHFESQPHRRAEDRALDELRERRERVVASTDGNVHLARRQLHRRTKHR